MTAAAPPLEVRRSARARRIGIRIDPARGVAELVLPEGAPRAEGDRFAARHRAWVAARLAELPPRRPFVHGARVPVADGAVEILHRPGGPAAARREGGRLVVGGPAAEVAPRVAGWLKALAREALREAATRHAEALGARFASLRVGDARTRWGSCSPRGALAFSWRLAMAPSRVLDYVAAHEAAHLLEANHGPRFWRLVARLRPDYAEARAWLRRRGPELHRYGG